MKQFSEAFGRWLEGSEITRIQWIALYYIYEEEGLSQRELGNLMCIKDSSVGRLVSRLERDGFIKRIKSEKDKRLINLELTEEGKSRFQEVLPLGEAFNDTLTSGVSDEDLAVFNSVLQKMLSNITNEE